MIGFNIYKAPPLVLEKINGLCTLLWQGKRKYEQVSAAIPNKELSRTILSLAQETNQYASELWCQILTLGGIYQKENRDSIETGVAGFLNEQDLMNFCELNEKELLGAYRDILNESFMHEGLRKMIRYQLNGILCSFSQLKLLNSLKFDNFRNAPLII